MKAIASRAWKTVVWACTSTLSTPRVGARSDIGPAAASTFLPAGAEAKRGVGSVERKYQTFWPRFWAGIVDGFVFLPVGIANLFVFRPPVPVWAQAIWFVIMSFGGIVYVVAMHARYGQTLGKMVMGVKVLDLSEAKLTARQAVMREIVPIVLTFIDVGRVIWFALAGRSAVIPEDPQHPGIGLWIQFAAGFGWFLAELVTMLTNAKRRALHDYIAGSVVVRLEKQASAGMIQKEAS